MAFNTRLTIVHVLERFDKKAFFIQFMYFHIFHIPVGSKDQSTGALKVPISQNYCLGDEYKTQPIMRTKSRYSLTQLCHYYNIDPFGPHDAPITMKKKLVVIHTRKHENNSLVTPFAYSNNIFNM